MADRLRPLLLTGLLLCSFPLSAHKLKVFALAEGVTIQGQAYFVGGAPASGAEIRIKDGEGNLLARLQPDTQGHFSYRIERVMDYEVVADTRDGHQMSWFLKAAEFTPESAAMTPAGASEGEAGDPASASPGTEQSRTKRQACGENASHPSESMVAALRDCESRQRLRDILGGLGYIVGLAGLGLWWSGRRGRGRS